MPKVKPNLAPLRTGGLTETDLTIHYGGASIPLEGRYTSTHWANRFGIEERSFKEWLNTYRIPFKRAGNFIIVDAVDFWEHLPNA